MDIHATTGAGDLAHDIESARSLIRKGDPSNWHLETSSQFGCYGSDVIAAIHLGRDINAPALVRHCATTHIMAVNTSLFGLGGGSTTHIIFSLEVVSPNGAKTLVPSTEREYELALERYRPISDSIYTHSQLVLADLPVRMMEVEWHAITENEFHGKIDDFNVACRIIRRSFFGFKPEAQYAIDLDYNGNSLPTLPGVCGDVAKKVFDFARANAS